jgi:putative endonuclease
MLLLSRFFLCLFLATSFSMCFCYYISVKQEKTQNTGVLGEEIACRFLVKHKYSILDRNYRKKCGEIDIVAKKEGNISFVEVKTVSHKVDQKDRFRPEENVHTQKLKRLSRAIEIYLLEKQIQNEGWNFLIIIVFLDRETKTASVRCIEEVIPER